MTNLRLLPPFEQQMDNSGEPMNGGTLQFYVAGTTTPLDTYSNLGLTIPNDNPIELNPAGRVMTNVYAPLNTLYDIVLKDGDGNTIRTEEDVEVTGTAFDPEGAGLFDVISDNLYPLLPPVVSSSASINYANSDWGKVTIRTNAGAMTDTLPSPSGSNFISGWYADYVCLGTSLTISAAANINGASSITLGTNDFARIVSTGSTYYAEVTNGGNLAARAGGTLTIATGVITVGNAAQYLVETEGAAASDDLVTINGTADGKLLFLRTVNDARDVVLKHNTGNIYNPALQDITLGKTQDIVLLRYDASLTKWIVISYQNASTKVPVFTTVYTSAATTYTNGGTFTLTHGLGSAPSLVQAYLVNVTAEANYTTGQVVYGNLGKGNGAAYGLSTIATATQLIVRVGANGLVLLDATTGAQAVATPANWTIVFKAWA
jgi:hypothetical protein